ncbi:hypothetical protein EBR96_06770 [bacterium]|nr:hypothetical protein [bacterium]
MKPLSGDDLVRELSVIQFRRYCLKVFPILIEKLKSQPLSYRHRLMKFADDVRKVSDPVVSAELMLDAFPDIPVEKIRAGYPKSELIARPKAIIDALRGFSH